VLIPLLSCDSNITGLSLIFCVKLMEVCFRMRAMARVGFARVFCHGRAEFFLCGFSEKAHLNVIYSYDREDILFWSRFAKADVRLVCGVLLGDLR